MTLQVERRVADITIDVEDLKDEDRALARMIQATREDVANLRTDVVKRLDALALDVAALKCAPKPGSGGNGGSHGSGSGHRAVLPSQSELALIQLVRDDSSRRTRIVYWVTGISLSALIGGLVTLIQTCNP